MSLILPSIGAFGHTVAAGGTSFTMLADLYDEANNSVYTFSSQTEANIIAVHGRMGSGSAANPSGVTMNGNTCIKVAGSALSLDDLSFWTCADADGVSTGDLVVTFTQTQARAFARTAYVEGFDLSAAIDNDFDFNNDNAAGALSLDCPAGGLIFCMARLHTISGLANGESSAYEVPAAWEIFSGAQTGFGITLVDESKNDQLGGAVSFAVA